MTCLSCSFAVPAGARFCPSCGHPVTSTATQGERKVVTVLFGDLVGYTTLAEHLDPEQVKRLIDGIFAGLVEDVSAFGGRVDKLLGDAIIALFGAPVAHEDDAERAVRAALRMHDTLASHIARLDGVPPVQMRIGINTGEVLVGTLAGTDYTAMGDVVNTASRLQSEAPPGGVVVGEDTYTLAREAIEFSAFGELTLRGRETPLAAWRAIAPTSQPGSRRRRVDLPLIGRDTEMALAMAGAGIALQQRRAVLVSLDGEGGVGKSRLVEEVLSRLRPIEDVTVLEGTCVPYGESNVWWPIAGALMEHLEIEQGASLEEVRAFAVEKGASLLGEVTDAIAAGQIADTFLHILGYPSSLDDMEPASARDVLTRSVITVLEGRLEKGPVVLAITDVHWADTVVIDLFERMLASLARCPFILVTSSRPDPDLAWPPTGSRAAIVHLPLEPLDRLHAGQLVSAVLGGEANEATIQHIFDRSGGNPLFLAELADLVAEGGAVDELPDSLRALVAARLDRLPPDQRAIIDNAAVLGTTGKLVAIERFAEELGQDASTAVLGAVQDAGLLEIEGSRWRFRSDSVREVAYQTLTKAVRAERHAGVAASMAASGRGSLDDIAHHLATAAELAEELGNLPSIPASIRTDAVEALSAAASRAFDQGTLRVTIRQATRAIDLLGEAARTQARPTLLVRAAANAELRRVDEARADLLVVLATAEADDDTASLAEAHRLSGVLLQLEGDLPSARTELGQAVDLLRELDAPSDLARALRSRGFMELFGGSLRDAEWFFGEAEGLYRGLGDRRGLAWIDQHRAWASFLSGDIAQAEERLHRAARTLAEMGDRNGVGWAFGLLAWVRFYNRQFDEAEDLAQIVVGEATDRGDDWAVGMMQTLRAALRLWRGELDDALSLAESARARFKRTGDRFGEIQAMAPLLRAQVATGRTVAAARGIEELIAGDSGYGATAFPFLIAAGAAVHGGDGQRGLALAEEALEKMTMMQGGADEPHIVRALALAQIGRVDDAVVALGELDPITAGHPFAASTSVLLSALDGRPTDAIGQMERFGDLDGATYLDRVVAHVGAGAARASSGDDDAARTELSAAVDVALGAGDVVATSFACSAHLHVLGEAHAHGEGDPAVLGAGWLRVVEGLPTARFAAHG
jgi:class 3 adenylate cyclase/tetratricopeptide (TPR) repeat protein